MIMHLAHTELQKSCMSKHSLGRSTRCTHYRVRHPAGSTEDVCPRGSKDKFTSPELMVRSITPTLRRKLDKICSKSFRSIFGEKTFFSKKHCFVKSRGTSKLFYLIRCCFCNLYRFLKLLYKQDSSFLDNIYGKWKFISFSLNRYKTWMQKNNFPGVCITKHTTTEDIYICAKLEQNPMSTFKNDVS